MRIKSRYHRIDGWRGYPVPGTALVGVSYTGEWSDSPCRRDEGLSEIRKFRQEVLKPARIRSHTRWGVTSNVFCCKRWLCVKAEDFAAAVPLALEWLKKNDAGTRLIHGAELEGVAQ
jgi:hypothetical protein